MNGGPKMFRIDPDPENRAMEAIKEVEFSELGFQERRDIQEWVAANPSILADDLLIIGKEFSGFDLTNERLDLLAVDTDGKLVVIELKRDDSGSDAHWQAIKYASYFRNTPADRIIEMLAGYSDTDEDEAANRLLRHLQSDDFNGLNHDQRIILASHRFAPEVTSAVLWLNEKVPGENLITCIQLIPYQDHDRLYIQASTIIPLPGIDDYLVKVGSNVPASGGRGSSLGEKLSRAFEQGRNHETTPFLKRIGNLALDSLPVEIRPNRTSRWAGAGQADSRYYHLWYSSPPWSNWGMSYRVNLYPQTEPGEWQARVEFHHDQNGLSEWLEENATYGHLPDGLMKEIYQDGIATNLGNDTLNDDFGGKIAAIVCKFVEEITPVVTVFVEEGNQEQV